MSWIMTKRGSQDNIITYEHYCDTFSDLSNIPSSQVTLGSTAVVINDEDNGLGIYMANSQKEWVPISTSIGGGSGEITLDLIHICSSEEYNSSTKVPTIEDAEVNKIYLVPNNSNGNNLFDEWIYVDDAWEKIGGGNINIPVSDVQVNDISIVNQGIAGLYVGPGLKYGSQTIMVSKATDAQIKAGTDQNRPVVPYNQHEASFYGLAKAAGDSTQSASNNAVGTYTNEAKAAIQQMLDVPSNSDMSAYATKTDTVLETTLSGGRKENTTVGEGSFAFGSSVEASGSASHAEGAFTVASGPGSHAEGTNTIASGSYSHAENGVNASGYKTIASGDFSHAEGGTTLAAGRAAHSEGWKTKANGMYAHAEGLNTISNGKSSHAAGKYNIEDSYISWPEWTASTEYEVGAKVKVTTTINNETTITGYICKTANTDTEFTASKWTEDAHMNYAHIVGNGTADNARSNAYALDWNGNGHFAGDVYVGANADSTGGTKLVKDVQVAGTSVTSNGVASIPYANENVVGVVKVSPNWGIGIYNGTLLINGASANDVKSGNNSTKAISAYRQHESAFYGLAKAAGADMASSSNAVGTYTDTAKTAICSMIGAVSSNQGAVNAGKVLGIGNDGSVSPVSAGSSSTLYGLQDTNFVQQNLIPGDALTYSYAADGTMTWSNVPLMYSCSLAESDFGGSSTYTYLLITNRHHQDGSDLEFYIEQGSRVVVYNQDTTTPALFSIGFAILNNGEMDERGNMLYEVWFIDVTQGHSPLVVRRFRKTYIEDAQDYYYIEIT